MTLPLPAVQPIVLDDDALPTNASAQGIVRCLCLLADEAMTLKLPATQSAIQDAVRTALAETGVSGAYISRRLLH
jgi:hypothetical protein